MSQLKGQDGTFETVFVKGKGGTVRINAHEYDEKKHGKQVDAPQQRAGGKRKARGAKADQASYEDMTVPELQTELDRRGVEYKSDDHKDDLVKALKQSDK